MDGIVFKVRQNGKVINKTIYLAVGLNSEGFKEVLGMWLGESESASFWMSVLTDLRSRGVEDILITSTDNLKGFTEAITASSRSRSHKSVWFIKSGTLRAMWSGRIRSSSLLISSRSIQQRIKIWLGSR
jgi:transposase-like protein